MSELTIREAVAADEAAIARIVCDVAATGETYALPRDLDPTAAIAFWCEPPPVRVVVAERAGELVGTARWSPVRPAGGAHIATASFMVAPAAAGGGVGRALGEEVLRRAADDGYSAMQFNAVVETNEAAVRLWRSLGFAIMATIPAAFEHPHHGRVGLHVMHRALH